MPWGIFAAAKTSYVVLRMEPAVSPLFASLRGFQRLSVTH